MNYRELSLFSGYGGFSLGLRLAGIPIRTVGYVEIDTYGQKLIQARIRDGYLDWAPIIRDIRAADFRPMAGLVDIVTAGFPCQPHSLAGQQRGAADERNLWPDTLRVIREVGTGWVLLENVPGILVPVAGARTGYAGTVVGELSEIGYDCIWDCIPAAASGAPHLRWRWWCLATRQGISHASGGSVWVERERNGEQCPEQGETVTGDNGQDGVVAYAQGDRGEIQSLLRRRESNVDRSGEDVPEPQRFRCGRQPPDQGQGQAGRRGVAEGGEDLADADKLDGHHGGHGTSEIRWGRSEAPGIQGGVLGSESGWWATEPDFL